MPGGPEKIFLTASTLSGVRQLAAFVTPHDSVSGLKRQASGLFRNLSVLSPPSRPTHCVSAAVLTRLRSAWDRSPAEVAASARSFHTKPVIKLVQLLAGEPAMIPSKSRGNRCASINASRPPSEHPMK